MKRNVIYLAILLLCAAAFLLFLKGTQTRMDTQPPTISFAEGIAEFSTQDSRESYLQGVTARDDRDGDVTASLVVEDLKLMDSNGSIRITYAAFDVAGNVVKAEREAKFTDYESPRFSLNRAPAFAYGVNFDLFSLVRVQDSLAGDISHRVRISNLEESSIYDIGTHTVELRVTNTLGDTACIVIPVEIYPAGLYGATLQLTDYLIYQPVGKTLDVNAYLATFQQGDTTLSLTEALPEGYSLEVKNNVQKDVPGVYTVEYRLTRTEGTENYISTVTGYAKMIVVVEG